MPVRWFTWARHSRRVVGTWIAVATAFAGQAWADIPWHTNLAGAKVASSVSQRPVLVVFTAAWSEPSVALDSTALASPEAVALLTACYEPVRVDVDADPGLARAMGVAHLPTACVIDRDERVVARFDIPAAPTAFVAAAGRAVQQAALATAATAPVAPTGAGPAAPVPTASAVAPQPSAPAAPAADQTPALAASAPAWPAEKVTRPMTADGKAPALASQIEPPGAASTTPAAESTAAATVAPGPWLGQSAPAVPPTQPPAKSATRLPAWDSFQRSITGLFTRPESATKPATSVPPPTPSPVAPAGYTATDAGVSMPVGLDGYCPVSVMDKGTWVEGRAQWGVRHRGRTYLFAGQAEQQTFLAAPDRYAPGLSGDDPVLAFDSGRKVQGQRRYGITYQSRMYLFSSPETRDTFSADPTRYTARVTVAERPAAERTIVR
ncbi:MAG: hypothetical protein FJ309_09005 [Planctomycetes bacterium]|nr:hypothetical protein [Planctomycetota bacterium]